MTRHSESSTPTSDTAQATSLYVYGVIPAAEAADWPGVDGIESPVKTVVEGDLAALVSDIPADRTPGLRADLEAHRRVLGLAIQHTTTIPMRFGIVMDTEDLVRERLLTKHHPELTELMEKLDGQVQMTVRAFYAEDELLRDVTESYPDIARRYAAIEGLPEMESRQERIELGKLVSEAVEVRRAQHEQALLESLQALATDIQVDPPSGERVALNAQVLVSREARPKLDELIAVLSKALEGRIALRYIGPLPPFSFSELALEPEGEE